MQGFFLGLANGTTCLAYCAPVLVPYLLGEGKNVRRNIVAMGQFLGGRLCGYLFFGVLAWATNQAILREAGLRDLLFGLMYTVLAALLFVYGFSNPPSACTGGLAGRLAPSLLSRRQYLLPAALGLLTGLNLCPPFLLAFTGAAGAGSLYKSLMFFFSFFLGTSVVILPAAFLGALTNLKPIRTVGRLSAACVALYYLYLGIVIIGGGIGGR
ncbi:MAG: sulfite exporter TauE/SafE family protein [Bacillota bacterium]